MKKIIAFCAAGAIALLAGCSSVSQEKYNSLESEESNLREQYRQLSVEHNDLQKQYDSLNSDYEELKSEYNSLQSAAESAAQTTGARNDRRACDYSPDNYSKAADRETRRSQGNDGRNQRAEQSQGLP